ncbi:ParA family protein [Microbacterium trichothecenolyticum]|uniref:CobQ/CobB/MinD/ParA nucleotide binding domain protein n=1 Tax=Microbacterium trichothecenolyticum TaxID=69370 RepID=A0A0M2HKU7_MICTR|nr:ParA family protein [Microbacterium trichothecenolyticum]KJL44997.1 CobQ/CobB/MinD/ParA nucleotide binding domain protein [Microbacterium trichothecenolyticum]
MTEIDPPPSGTRAPSMALIAVANQKGGVGKTTVAMQVAAELSRRHRVLVVDVDRQESTVWWAENARDLLPFDFAGSQHPNMLSRLRDLRADYEFVLVDTPGSLEDTAVLETVLDAADYALVPVTPEPLAVDPTLRTLSRLIEPRQLGHGVLLNRIDPRVPHQLQTWQGLLNSELGVPRLESYLRQYKVQADAPVLGQLVTSMRRNRRTEGAIADIAAIARELERLLSPALTGAW